MTDLSPDAAARLFARAAQMQREHLAITYDHGNQLIDAICEHGETIARLLDAKPAGLQIGVPQGDYAVLFRRAEAAEAERDLHKYNAATLSKAHDRLAAALAEAQARVEVMREALRMYALPEHWMALTDDADSPVTVWIARTHLDATPNGYSTAWQALMKVARPSINEGSK